VSKIHIEPPTQEKEIALGAEARITTGRFLNFTVVSKHRFEKQYRDPDIDIELRRKRTISELRLLQTAREIGVNTPYVLNVDKETWTITMMKLQGKSIKYFMDDDNLEQYFIKIGTAIGMLHNAGIIHGDLTTSNIILQDEEIWLIDFGLGFVSSHVENLAVDVLVLKHILESSHPLQSERAFSGFLQGYEKENQKYKQIMKRMNSVELRVRYRSH
jgi:Kae1-associated kinase Bud32